MNRLSVNTLLSSVIGILAATIVVMLALGAWDSWNRYTTINRITTVVETTGHLFKALHNLRYDRSNTNRDLLADKQLSGVSSLVKTAREHENAALKAALVSLATVEFADQKTAHADLTARVNKLLALQDESAAAFVKPKAERRADLAKDYMSETGALLTALDKLSGQLNQLVKLQDSFIDQMMALKQLAWIMRNASGDASLGVSNALAGLPIPPDAMASYTGHVGKADGAWAALEDLVAGMSLPAGLKGAIETVKREVFARDYIDLRTNILKAKLAGTDPGTTPDKWTPFTIAKLGLIVSAAESALDAAKDHAAAQRSAALQSLAVHCGLLVIATIFGGAMMLTVSRRVTKPLAMIQSVMMRLAKGDLTAEVSFAGRKDEIGALAQTTDVFRSSMTEAARLRGEQDEAERRANSQRKAEMQQLANEFEKAVGGIVATVSSAASELESAAGQLTQTADTTQQLSGMVASASEEASANVQSVASAAEEMSASVSEISRQVHEFEQDRGRSRRAGPQDRRTDPRTVEFGRPDRRRCEADHRNRGADQSPGTQRDDRSGPRRRSRKGFCDRRTGGESARQPDRKGDRRDRNADLRHADGYAGFRDRDQGDRRHHRSYLRNRRRHRGRCRRARRSDAGDLAQRPGGRARHDGGREQYRQRESRRQRNRIGLVASPALGTVAVERKRAAQDAGSGLRRDGSRRLSGELPSTTAPISARCLGQKPAEREGALPVLF